MKTHFRFVRFVERPPAGKTGRWWVMNVRSDEALGGVIWWGPSRQYVFVPSTGNAAVFSVRRLADIETFLRAANDGDRAARAAAKSEGGAE